MQAHIKWGGQSKQVTIDAVSMQAAYMCGFVDLAEYREHAGAYKGGWIKQTSDDRCREHAGCIYVWIGLSTVRMQAHIKWGGHSKQGTIDAVSMQAVYMCGLG